MLFNYLTTDLKQPNNQRAHTAEAANEKKKKKKLPMGTN